jgi:hypothetical protein
MAPRPFLFLIIKATKKTLTTSMELIIISRVLGVFTINKQKHDKSEAE